MPIPFKLDDIIERLLREDTPECRMIQALIGVRLPNREAQAAWHRVLEHKWYISERLGRDVGFRVAAVDFFDNIYILGGQNSGSRLTNWIRLVPWAMQNLA